MNEVTRLQPRQRIIVACDVEGSTSRTNPAKAALRLDMYDLLEETLRACDITEEVREPFYDRGDGAMLLLRPVDGVPKTMLLHTFVPKMTERLAEHSATYPGRSFRLRIALHSGEVHFDTRGVFGADIDLTFRLLNSRDLKRRLRETDAPLVLAVSNYIHQSVISHGYDGIDGRTFEPAICLQVADQRHVGWVQVPTAPSADLFSA
jgi:hypothetical protein